jgi:hypothetical protein
VIGGNVSAKVFGINRDDATRRVMLAIAMGPDVVSLPFEASDGTRPLVVATPNEDVSDVLKRVAAAGGGANIALAEARKFTIFMITSESIEAIPEAADEVNKDMSMGMFYLRMSRGGKRTGTFKVKNVAATIPSLRREFAYN